MNKYRGYLFLILSFILASQSDLLGALVPSMLAAVSLAFSIVCFVIPDDRKAISIIKKEPIIVILSMLASSMHLYTGILLLLFLLVK